MNLFELALPVAAGVGYVATYNRMRRAVNDKPPPSLRIGFFDPFAGRYEVLSLHRQFYPESDLRRQHWLLVVAILAFGALQALAPH